MRQLLDRSLLVAAVLSIAFCSLTAKAQDAKGYFEKAQTAGDQCLQMQYVCKAAELDSKKKEYKQACDSSRASLVASDRDSLKKAHDALDGGKFPQATRYAKYVCKANPDQYAEAQQIIQDVQKAQAPAASTVAVATAPVQPAVAAKADQSSTYYKQAKDAFDAGNFDAARSAAGQVTDASLKSMANDIVASISRYQSDIAAAKQHEAAGDLDGAVKSYQSALSISSRVPDGAAAHMQELQNKAHPSAAPVVAKVEPPPANPKNQPNQPAKPPAEDPSVTVARLMDEASKAQAAGKLQDALKSYEAVLRIQPGNGAAMSGRGAVQAIISSDPAEQAKTLAQAIRDFYATKYSDAEDELSSYLSSTNVKSRGAAHFYLAATRLSRSLLDKPASPQSVQAALHNPDIQKLFKQSSGEQYKPVERYVSPLIMEVWRSASGGR